MDEVAACRKAQRAWADLPVRDRLAPVRRFRALLVERSDELTAAVEADVQRPPNEVLGSDVLPLAAAAKFLQRKAARILKARRVRGTPLWLFGEKDWVHRRPHGVVAVIGTWNYPLLLNGVQILQALVAGNGVAWKPSEHGDRSAAVLHGMLLEAGVPAELFRRLPSTREAGSKLLESDVDYVTFTGSAAVGRQIGKRLGERLIPSALELSGCDAMFVAGDADPEFAAKAAWFGVTLNRGQTCLAVRRIFVERPLLETFVEALHRHVEQATPVSVVTEAQVLQAEKLFTDAIARGARPLDDSRPIRHGERQVLPQVLLHDSTDMEICRVDCFAPIAAVIPVASLEQAVEMDAGCPYALGASLFTGDMKRAERLAPQLRTGSLSVNDVIAPTAHPETPFGGRGASGWGVTQGAEGLLAMTVPQVVSYRGGRYRPHYDGAPGGLLRGLLAVAHAPTLRGRLGGVWQIVRGARQKNSRDVTMSHPGAPSRGSNAGSDPRVGDSTDAGRIPGGIH